jgi:hypothetical protein
MLVTPSTAAVVALPFHSMHAHAHACMSTAGAQHLRLYSRLVRVNMSWATISSPHSPPAAHHPPLPAAAGVYVLDSSNVQHYCFSNCCRRRVRAGRASPQAVASACGCHHSCNSCHRHGPCSTHTRQQPHGERPYGSRLGAKQRNSDSASSALSQTTCCPGLTGSRVDAAQPAGWLAGLQRAGS